MKILKIIDRNRAYIALNRPESRNAMNIELLDELYEALISLESTVQVIVVTGSSQFFCSGMDLKELQEASNQNKRSQYLKKFRAKLKRVLDFLESFRGISFSFIEGGAYGGGVGLALACDVCCATSFSKLCLPEIKKGVLPKQIMPILLKKLNKVKMYQMILSAEPVLAKDLTQDLWVFQDQIEFRGFLEKVNDQLLSDLKLCVMSSN